jgi:hypothetical protein
MAARCFSCGGILDGSSLAEAHWRDIIVKVLYHCVVCQEDHPKAVGEYSKDEI